jgi:hypothetical protein
VELRVVGLGVGRRSLERVPGLRAGRGGGGRTLGRLADDERKEARAVETVRHVDADDVEHRRRDVDEAREPAHAQAGERSFRGARLASGRERQDHRHVERRAVEKDAVRRLSVLAERLAVIGDVEDDGVAPPARAVERREEASDLGVGVGDLAGIGRRSPAAILLGRRVRLVRIVQVDPQVERMAATPRRAEPRERSVHDAAARPLDIGEVAALEARVIERVVVGLMALGEAPPRGEHVGADEGRGVVAALEQPLGQRSRGRRQHEAAVVPDAVARGIEAREHRRMRRERHGDVGHRVLEHDALAGQPRRGRGLERRAIGCEVVAPQRVDRHDEHVGSGEARPRDGCDFRCRHPAGEGERGFRRPRGGRGPPAVRRRQANAQRERRHCGTRPGPRHDYRTSPARQ